MARGRYSKWRQVQREREERARVSSTVVGEEPRHVRRLHCTTCGAWLVEVDQNGSVIAVRDRVATRYFLDSWRELDEEGTIDFEMDDVVNLEVECPQCREHRDLGNHSRL